MSDNTHESFRTHTTANTDRIQSCTRSKVAKGVESFNVVLMNTNESDNSTSPILGMKAEHHYIHLLPDSHGDLLGDPSSSVDHSMRTSHMIPKDVLDIHSTNSQQGLAINVLDFILYAY